jgi:hypothetical protein
MDFSHYLSFSQNGAVKIYTLEFDKRHFSLPTEEALMESDASQESPNAEQTDESPLSQPHDQETDVRNDTLDSETE